MRLKDEDAIRVEWELGETCEDCKWDGSCGCSDNQRMCLCEALSMAEPVNPYKVVFDELMNVTVFRGDYAAVNGNKHFMYGVLTVMEFIAERAGEGDAFSDLFIQNMIMAEEIAEEIAKERR